jgi:hypothetical protein
MATANIFYPYETVTQNTTALALQTTRKKQNLWRWLLRLAPLFSLLMGVVMYVISKELLILLTLVLFAVLEAIILLFVRIPVAVKMDSLGLMVDVLSLKGEKQLHYLWQDIDHLRYRTMRTKTGRLLVYYAVLNTKKKVRLLSFSSTWNKFENMSRIKEVLQQVSRKEVKNR